MNENNDLLSTATSTPAPVPVVQVLSPLGIEYVFLTINLFAGAGGLIAALVALVNGNASFDVLAFPVAVLFVAVPLFAALFLRLKRAELRNPALKLEPSKRRSTQFTQVVAYLTVFFALISLVTGIFASIGGQFTGSLVKFIVDILIVILVAGGILAYYWHDEHKEV